MADHEFKTFTGERPLYGCKGLFVKECVFEDGESPIKECSDITLEGCTFGWKYPIWYSNDIQVRGTTWLTDARAGVWYCRNITVSDSLINAPKNFRRCSGISLKGVEFTNALETLWGCNDINMSDVSVKGDYFGMNCYDIKADNLRIMGNYSFDGARNIEITNSELITKDAFWNCENVTVKNSFISGEYIGWNSKHLTFENCTIESLQGLCYIEDLVLRNCTLNNTTLAFEYSSVDAELNGKVDSILNPLKGTIKVPSIGELIVEKDRVDAEATKIDCDKIEKISERPEWLM